MLGLVIALVAATASVPGTGPGSPACDGDGPPSCDLAPLAGPAARPHEEYATPSVIDSPPAIVPIVAIDPSAPVGECDWPHDASYRTSRFPEGEDSQSLSPGGRERRGGVSSCNGLPQKAPSLPLSDAQPLAVYAKAVTVQVSAPAEPAPQVLQLPSRFGDPPDRPPRV
jgi:hypothetical protein